MFEFLDELPTVLDDHSVGMTRPYFADSSVDAGGVLR